MQVKKVLVTGGNGQLGLSLAKNSISFPALNIIPADIEEMDISRAEQVHEFYRETMPGLVVNCAAYTAVDRAEDDRETAFGVNKTGPANIASACLEYSIPLIHVSTDYVFSGKGENPCRENDITDPVTVYGKSKLEGENEIIRSGVNGIIIRTSWLYSEFGQNFVKSMVNLGKTKKEIGVVSDQTGSPTYAGDLAMAILNIAEKFFAYLENTSPAEIFHYSNRGVCSWKDLASLVMQEYGLNCRVRPVSTSEFPRRAPRPAYSVLDTNKIRNIFKLEIPLWEESLKKCIANIKSEN